MFVNVWTTHGKSVTEELKQRSLTPKQVIMSQQGLHISTQPKTPQT